MADDRDTIRDLKRRRGALDQKYTDWEPHFRELRDWIKPSLGRFELSEDRHSSTINKRILDSTASRGLRTLRSGLMAGMTSPSRRWFKIKASNDDLDDDPAVKQWAHIVEVRMYEVMRRSNVYRMLSTCYDNLGLYGTFGGLIVGDFENVVHAHSFPMGSYRLGVGDKGRVEHMHRTVEMSAGAMVSRFGIDKVSTPIRNAYDNGRYHDEFPVSHAIERRVDRDPSSPLPKNRPYASVYWEEKDRHILEISGFGAKPIIAPRWESIDSEPWATLSPGMEALGDVRSLQKLHLDAATAIKKSYDPPLQASANAGTTLNYRNVPGGVTMAQASDLNAGGLRPIYEVQPDISGLMELIREAQLRVNQAFFVDLFLMTAGSDRRQVTAREIAERHEEKLLTLGPVLESLDHDLLQPLIQAVFYHMQEAGILPEPPEALVDTPIKVEYISALAQAQKAVGVAPIERTVGFAATLEQVKPGTLDAYDADQALRDFVDQIGAPPTHMRSEQEVEKIRAERAKQMQQQQAIEAAQPLAQSAKLISEASERGQQGILRGSPL